MALTGDEALVGRVLNDRYLIRERIARGGMASVFQATDQRLDRAVAIKVMHHGLGDDRQFTERFVREAKSAAKLNHPNVVSVFDQGMDGEVTYLVMEYVPGRTLRDIMREESPMPPHRALELLEQILIALSAAYAAHIIHRDVKPENVLITPDGKVKVADFGLARAVSAATTATGGTLIGTVSYLAPEIVVNEGADARSDVYACGAMLYEMLTGVKPHTGESPIQVAYKHVHEDIGKPSSVQGGIPPYVDALVARATVRDRDQRSTDARVMLQQVRSVQRALNAGLADDPDLVADLLPGGRTPEDDGDSTVVVPQIGSGTANGSSASDSAPTEAVHTSEPTMQWSREAEAAAPATPQPGLLPVMSTEEYKQIRAEHPRSHRGRNLLVLSIVLALLAALLGWYIGIGRYTDTPLLTGKDEATAKTFAEEKGFKFHVSSRQFSEKFANGLVITTSPEAHSKILPGGTIDAVISKGKNRVFLPARLKGMTVDEATSTLEALGLKVGEITQKYDDKVDKGGVIRATDYTTKSPLRLGTRVNLIISKGRQPVHVDNYTGQDATAADAALKKVGFKVSVDRKFNDSVPKGIVISQSPNGGTRFKGDTITLIVSKGQDLVDVPNVVDRHRVTAVKILEAAGFKVQALGTGNFVVRSQSPGSGQAKRGSTVTITFVAFP
ncbi:MAG: pknB [Aeromicrobium sp.]|nr:pknB [Aeromicrobium sp.]